MNRREEIYIILDALENQVREAAKNDKEIVNLMIKNGKLLEQYRSELNQLLKGLNKS